jgi:hypothetical protein
MIEKWCEGERQSRHAADIEPTFPVARHPFRMCGSELRRAFWPTAHPTSTKPKLNAEEASLYAAVRCNLGREVMNP